MVGSSIEKYDNPIHFVTFPSFYLMKEEVTQADYRAIMGNNPSNFTGDRNPVETVTWHNAVEYAKQLSLRSEDISNSVKEAIRPLSSVAYMKYALMNPKAGLFRLLTESEWEFAARGQVNGSSENYPWGNTINDIDAYAQTSRNSKLTSTQPVGLLKSNGFGLNDMIANVWEWTASGYKSDAFQADEHYDHPTGIEDGKCRVLRGGSWCGGKGSNFSVAYRNNRDPDYRNDGVGFRIGRTNP